MDLSISDAIHAQIVAHTHLSSLPSLFSRAIIQSGPLAPRHIWSIARLDRIWNKMLRGHGDSISDRIARLRGTDPDQLLRLAHDTAEVRHTARSVSDRSQVGTWGVFSDGIFVSPKAFDSESNFKPFRPRAEAVMIGDCADEVSGREKAYLINREAFSSHVAEEEGLVHSSMHS